ncbi:MAG: hypothetical protein ABIO04_14175 [Ferruginibacter sp.]
MKTQLSNILAPLSKSEVNGLAVEVKETLAFDNDHLKTKSLSAAELWTIQRRQRTINPTRRFVY